MTNLVTQICTIFGDAATAPGAVSNCGTAST